MFSKILIASAAKPAGPVTLTWSPPPGSLTRLRMSSIGSRIVSDSPSPRDVADQQRRVARLRGLRPAERRDRAVDPALALLDRPVELDAVGRDACPVGRREPALAAVDDHDRRLLAALELLGDAEHLGRLGVAGQEGRGLVVLGVGVLAGQVEPDRAEDDEQPDAADEPLGRPTAGKGEEYRVTSPGGGESIARAHPWGSRTSILGHGARGCSAVKARRGRGGIAGPERATSSP